MYVILCTQKLRGYSFQFDIEFVANIEKLISFDSLDVEVEQKGDTVIFLNIDIEQIARGLREEKGLP